MEYLCGRSTSSARAALRLIRLGFYDEALGLCRSLGEVANLLHLFSIDRTTFGTWKALSRSERLREFSPLKIRTLLEERGSGPHIDQERYRLLSKRAAHVNPSTRPQAHNILGIPSAGSVVQEEGLLVSINELALPMALVALFGTQLLELERDVQMEIFSAARSLVEFIGRATICDIAAYHDSIIQKPKVKGGA